MMFFQKPLFYFLALLGVFTFFTVFFVLENFIVILEQASVLSIRPIRLKMPRSLIHEQVVKTKQTTLRLDIYKQPYKKNDTLHPVLVFIPGGLWQGYNKKNYAHIAGVAYKENFITVVPQLPHYSGFITRRFQNAETLARGGFRGQREALQAIFFWLNNNIQKFRGDPKKLFIAGFGSGTQLISSLFFKSEYKKIDKNQKSSMREIKKNIQKMFFFSPILDVNETGAQFLEKHIQPIFQNINRSTLAFLRKKIDINFPILILSPEQDFPFLHKQAKIFSQTNTNIKYMMIAGASRRSLIFKIGRKNLATRLFIQFLQ